MDLEKIYNIIINSQEKYNNSSEQIYSDEEFDALVDFYEKQTGVKLNLIGAKPPDKVVELPYPMPSVDKIKGKNADKDLQKFLEKNQSSVIIEDKLDGISVLAVYQQGKLKLYNRGDGLHGQDISYIQDYVQFPSLNHNIVVKGELIMHKSDFENLQETYIHTNNKMKKARTLVNGAITKKDASDSLLSYCKFYAFEIVYDEHDVENGLYAQTPQFMFNKLIHYEFNVPFHMYMEVPTLEILTELLKQRRIDCLYEIDGLVMVSNNNIPYTTENENPKNKVAFKIDTIVISKVLNIEWGITSRYGYLTPIIHIEPVDILGSEVSKASGHNGKYIAQKQVGIGAIVEVTLCGDIIPQIANVLVPSSNIPHPHVPYHWNENGVEVLVNDLNAYSEIKIESIACFFKHLSVKLCGISTINKIFYGANIQTIDGFLNMKESQICNIGGLGLKSASNIVSEISKGIKNATYPKLMVAIGIFGEGIGEKRFEEFIEAFPSWKYVDIQAEDIQKVPGFGPIISQKIATYLPEFKEWFWNRISLFGHLEKKTNPENNGIQDLKGETIVFSGFRDDSFKTDLENRGAKVSASFVKSTTLLIVKSKSENSSKINEAQKKGIPIIQRSEFK